MENPNASAREPAALAARREQMKHRRRRLIYNNDGNELFFPGADTPEGFLAMRFQPVLGTQVDSIFYCTGVTTMYGHQPKVGEVYGEFCRARSPDEGSLNESDIHGACARDNARALASLGHDILGLAVDFCHRNGVEIFFSHRINDVHDAFTPWLLSRWKREHPQCLMGTSEERDRVRDINSPRFWWTALDFEHPEVRDYLCRIQEDVCERYDVDGVEIDYFRSPMFFRPNLEFQPATQEQVGILTDFQRRMREIAYRVGTRRGRPMLMATRVSATVEKCRHVGIDIVRWLEEGLLDVLTVSGGYVPFTEPLEEMVALAHGYGIPIYPAISDSGLGSRNLRYGSLEAWRGAASNTWRAGADGIYTFNIFPSGPEPRFLEMGSPETLAGLNKRFAIEGEEAVLHGQLIQAIEQSQTLPAALPGDGQPRTVILPIGDDLPAAEAAGTLESAVLRIQLHPPELVDGTEIRLNGILLDPVEKDLKGGWLAFRTRGDRYRLGKNDISIRVPASPGGQSPGDVVTVELDVCYI